MAAGVSLYLANAWLNAIKSAGTSYTAPTTVHAKLHISAGSPGNDCTGNPSSVTTRMALTFSNVTTGVMNSSSSPSWSSWAGSNNEILRYISVWDNSTAGNGLWWAQLSQDKTINTGDTFTLTSCSLTITPAA